MKHQFCSKLGNNMLATAYDAANQSQCSI